MTKIHNIEHFNKAKQFIKLDKQLKKSFKDCIGQLNRIKRNYSEMYGPTILHLFPDFVEHSFVFGFENNEKLRLLNGGLILHGYQQTFSIEINPNNKPHYSIHT